MLKKNFIRGLISVKDNDKKVIFMNIPELVETHTAFYAGVRDAGNNLMKQMQMFIKKSLIIQFQRWKIKYLTRKESKKK